MTKPIDPQAKDWEVALAKYAVIVPLVARVLDHGERELLRGQILSATYVFPGARTVTVAPRTLRRWIQLHRDQGLEGLLPTTRSDKGTSRAIPANVLDAATKLKAEVPTRSAQTIADLLKEPGAAPVSPSTLAYHFRGKGMTRVKDPKAFTRFEHARPNDCWQSDLSDGLWLPDPQEPGKMRKCYLHAFIDDHSRLVPHARFYWRESLPALEDCFRKAISKHGIPRMVYWDNGSVFRATQLRKMAARLGIEVVFSTPYAPEGRGKIERFFGVLKASFFPEAMRAGITTLDELNAFLAAWLEQHHNRRTHSQTGATPLDRWEAGREHVRFPTPDELADTFTWEEERQVRKTGTISLSGNDYPVEPRLVGQRVIVRFDPFDLSTVKIVHHGQVVDPAARPVELVSRTFSKATPATPEPPKPLDSSKGYKERLTQLDAGRKAGWGTAQASPTSPLTADLALQVSALLGGRLFDPAEEDLLAAFRRQYALDPRVVDRVVPDAVALKGMERPLSYYLDAIVEGMRHEGGRS